MDIAQEVKNIYFKRHPELRCVDREEFIEKVVEIIGIDFEVYVKKFQEKNQRRFLRKGNNHGFHKRNHLYSVGKTK